MSTETVTMFFALLAFACNVFVIGVAIVWFTRRDALRDLIGPNALTLAAVIAVVATAGSLYLSEVAHFLPCRLCWFQRIGMYPLALILPIMAWRKDIRAWIYPFALSVLAVPISIYHVLLERWPSLETGTCDPNNPCSIVWVRHFGVATIPYMAGSAFVAIAVCCALAAAGRKELSNVEDSNEIPTEDQDQSSPERAATVV